MSSLILELQQEILNPNSDIMSLLRKAHIIACKLQLNEFDKWILSELNGYSDYNGIPDYRLVTGSVKAWNPYHGWVPVILNNDKFEAILCNRKMGESLGKIIELENKTETTFQIYYSAEISATLSSMSNVRIPTQYALHASAHQLHSIIEQVKNAILEWTIRLENEGIVGENMQFNSTEKESAKRIPQTVNNYYGNTNIINGNVDDSAVIAGDNNSVALTYEKAAEVVSDIETSLKMESISAEDQENAMEMLKEIKDKVSKQKKPSVIKAALVGLKDFLIGVGASATVALVQAKIQGLF